MDKEKLIADLYYASEYIKEAELQRIGSFRFCIEMALKNINAAKGILENLLNYDSSNFSR